MSALYNVNLMPADDKSPDRAPISQKVINVVGDSIPAVIEKVNAVYPGCEIRAVTKVQNIDIP